MVDQRLEQHRRSGFVDRGIALDRVHRLADADLGGEVYHGVDALQRMGNHVLVANVSDDELGVAGKVLGPLTIAVDLLDQAVAPADRIAAAKKLASDCATNKPCATRD